MASEVWLSPPSRLPSVANPPPRFAYKSRPTASFLISPSSRTPRALPALRRRVLLRRRLRATEQQGQVQEQD
uniref:Uncharacterized protein n=1 Tax=Arundo donax TaxID=35708 RepID=A0A0A9HM91_ARUDO